MVFTHVYLTNIFQVRWQVIYLQIIKMAIKYSYINYGKFWVCDVCLEKFSNILKNIYNIYLFLHLTNYMSKVVWGAAGKVVETDGDFVLKLTSFSIDSRKEKGYQMDFDCTHNSKITNSTGKTMLLVLLRLWLTFSLIPYQIKK